MTGMLEVTRNENIVVSPFVILSIFDVNYDLFKKI